MVKLLPGLSAPAPGYPAGGAGELKKADDGMNKETAEDFLNLLQVAAGDRLWQGADDGIAKETAEECSNLVQVAAGDRLCQESPAVQSWKVPHKHGRKYFPQALIHKKLDGHHLSFAGASGSACVANRGSPDSALGGLPLPPPLSGVRSAQKGEGGVVHLGALRGLP